jgi:hypothetical protein
MAKIFATPGVVADITAGLYAKEKSNPYDINLQTDDLACLENGDRVKTTCRSTKEI